MQDAMHNPPSKDHEWFINGKTTVDWTEPVDWDPAKSLTNMPGRKLSERTFCLQGPAPKSTIYYKDLFVRPLP